MVNEQNNFSDREGADVAVLLSTLNRVEAPGDFNFRVKARIAKGRPAPTRRPWATLALRLSLPAVVLATAGGYLGYGSLSSDNFGVAAVNDAPASIAVTTTQNLVPATPENQIAVTQPQLPTPTADTVAVATAEQPTRSPKGAQKTPSTPKPEAEQPGGSYVEAQAGAKTLNSKDVNDNDTKPVRKLIISAAQLLSNSGVVATSNGKGGRIQSVSGAGASAGLKAGDVIEAVSVASGTIRVTRDGESVTVTIR